jgi:hypothetical protein
MADQKIRSDVHLTHDGKLVSKSSGAPLPVGDVRAKFAAITSRQPRDDAGQRAFLASKRRMVATHPKLDAPARMAAEAVFKTLARPAAIDDEVKAPVPGGVGYGFFYNAQFKTAFQTGTAIAVDIVCPTQPGGNVTTYLYLTTMNRAAKGIEAFVSYQGQNDTRFKVFDWARPDQWQTNIPFANMQDYLVQQSYQGVAHQVLGLQNHTYETASGQWRNLAWLFNHRTNTYDLIYDFAYPATLAVQQTGWTGSWCPIVETFQDSYQGTSQLGFMNAYLQARDASGAWSDWQLLSTSQCDMRNDGKGFNVALLDPNFSFVVN